MRPLKSNNLYLNLGEKLQHHSNACARTKIKPLIPLGPLRVAYGNKPNTTKNKMWLTHTPALTHTNECTCKCTHKYTSNT